LKLRQLLSCRLLPAALTLFVSNPQLLVIEVAPVENGPLDAQDYECIQAKIGLEVLTLESSEVTARGRRMVFQGPQAEAYQSGVQVAFLGMTPVQDLSDGKSRFRLLNVRWRDERL
jgi:hypothetical protein